MAATRYFQRVNPEAVEINPAGINHFLAAIDKAGIELHSFMVIRHGKVAAEGWWHPYAAELPHMLFSLSKSFTSTAVGFAVQEHILSVTDSILSFFPDYVTPEIRENMSSVQIRHLLSMSTGHAEDTMPALHQAPDGDWVRAFLNCPITHEPGSHFLYNTGATYMLSAILQTVTGQTLLDYLRPRLFHPLGIDNPSWEICPRGFNTGGFGLNIRTEDIAKFGLLYLNNGVWEGQQLLSPSWIEEATRGHISNGDDPNNDWNQGYGYQFWRCRHGAYRGDGAFGQNCIIMPAQDALFINTAGTGNHGGIFQAVWDHLLPAMSDASASIPTSASGNETLQSKLMALALPIPGNSEGIPLIAAEVSGQWFTIEDENPFGIKEIKFDFADNGFTITATDQAGEGKIEGSYSEWKENQTSLFAPTDGVTSAYVAGGWTPPNQFVTKVCYAETPFTGILDGRFTDSGLELTVKPTVAFNVDAMTVRLYGKPRP